MSEKRTALSYYLNLSERESKGSRSEPLTETKTLAHTVSGLMLSEHATALSFAHHLDVTGLPLVLRIFLGEWNKSKAQCFRGAYRRYIYILISATDHRSHIGCQMV